MGTLLIMMYAIIALCFFALAQSTDNRVHVSGYNAETKVFAMPYGAYGAGSYGGYGSGYGAGYGGYGAYGNLYGAYRAVDGYNTAYSPVSSYSSAYVAPVESYSSNYVSNSAYAPVQSYRNTYETVDYQPATTYASPDYSTGYRTGYSAPVAAYA